MSVQIVTDDLKRELYRVEGAIQATPAQMRRALGKAIIEVEREAKRTAPVGRYPGQGKVGGALKQSISNAVIGDDTAVLTVGVAYGSIQDKGGVTRPHIIRAKDRPFVTNFSWRKGNIVGARTVGRTGGMLAFKIGGQMIFRKQVNHPGSRIPPKHYARQAFENAKPQVEWVLKNAAKETIGGKA